VNTELQPKLDGAADYLGNITAAGHSYVLSSARLEREKRRLAAFGTLVSFREAITTAASVDGKLSGIDIDKVHRAISEVGGVGMPLAKALSSVEGEMPLDYIDASVRSYDVVSKDLVEFVSDYKKAKASGTVDEDEALKAAFEVEAEWVKNIHAQLVEYAEQYGVEEYGPIMHAACAGAMIQFKDENEEKLYKTASVTWKGAKPEMEVAVRLAALKVKYGEDSQTFADAEHILNYSLNADVE